MRLFELFIYNSWLTFTKFSYLKDLHQYKAQLNQYQDSFSFFKQSKIIFIYGCWILYSRPVI